ncbi:MAG: N-alpha-acetyltransferase auxiliary subunit-like [Trebouxia sp. A1-2]|nr:MAG: N-alpha-acetyltransferase auxiliary subunit-like [Trebouxia sp. A1-2]
MSGGETATISVITSDGRQIVGLLKGYDQATNLILDECHERVYSTKAGVEKLALGLYVIRGDNMTKGKDFGGCPTAFVTSGGSSKCAEDARAPVIPPNTEVGLGPPDSACKCEGADSVGWGTKLWMLY